MFDDDLFDDIDSDSTAESADTPSRDEPGGLLHEAIQELPGMDDEQAFSHLEEVIDVEFERMEDGPEKDTLKEQYDEVFQNNVTYEPTFCRNDDHPDRTDFEVSLSPELPADRVLSTGQRATLRGAIRRIVGMPAETRPAEEHVIYVDGVGIVHIAYNDLNVTFTVEGRHTVDVGSLTTASVIGCDDHPLGDRHSDDLDPLGELNPRAADLEADIIETAILMLQGTGDRAPDADDDGVTPIGDPWLFPFGRSFDSVKCNSDRLSFELTVSVKEDINTIYSDEMVEEADRLGIPLEPTMEERGV